MTPIHVAILFAALGLAVHLFTNGGYGYFRDEFLYMAAGEHLDWGYVDHAPLIGLVAWLNRALLGDSLRALRFLPAVAAAAKILLTGLIARELGGGRFAVALACLCVLVAPVYLGIDTIFTMNAFEPLFWMGCVYILLRAIQRDRPRLLVWFGALAGLGLMMKHSMVFFGVALVVGLVLTRERRLLANRWFWIGGALALAIFLPNLIWQAQRGWPTIEDLVNVRRTGKNVDVGPVAFLAQQALIMLPASLLVWLPGLWLLFRRQRFLAWSYMVVLALMIALEGKHYYLAPAYPMLFAAGGVFLEARRRTGWAVASLVAITGALIAPTVLPVLPPQTLIRYQEAIGLPLPKTEVGHVGKLPQIFGDMFGWPEMVETVAKVYHALPAVERSKAAILAGNYGEAGAIDFFGPRHGLPKAISGHQTYFYWGPRHYTGEVLILLQSRRQTAERYCRSVEDGPETGHPWGMGEEHYRILICRGLRPPLPELWPRLKHWN